jgi:hypothetical protein
MIAVKTTFDGNMIHVPDELRGAKPAEVLVVFEEEALVAGKGSHSIWDVVGKYQGNRTAGDIDAQVRQEHESWGDR